MLCSKLNENHSNKNVAKQMYNVLLRCNNFFFLFTTADSDCTYRKNDLGNYLLLFNIAYTTVYDCVCLPIFTHFFFHINNFCELYRGSISKIKLSNQFSTDRNMCIQMSV